MGHEGQPRENCNEFTRPVRMGVWDKLESYRTSKEQ